MTTEEKTRLVKLGSIQPGETLAEEIEFRGISVKELSAQSGLSEHLVDEIIGGEKPITATVARALAESLEIPQEFWTKLQDKYDHLTISRNRSTASVLRDPGSEWGE